MRRIGMLTSGGDCQALNAAMRGVVKSLYNSGEEVEIYGFLNGCCECHCNLSAGNRIVPKYGKGKSFTVLY